MYSREKRLKAVEFYIKFGKSAAAVIRDLGYPNLLHISLQNYRWNCTICAEEMQLFPDPDPDLHPSEQGNS